MLQKLLSLEVIGGPTFRNNKTMAAGRWFGKVKLTPKTVEDPNLVPNTNWVARWCYIH